MVEIRNLNYKSILKDINIKFQKNSINFISGSNNSGKSTLIRILGGLIDTENTVFIDGIDLYGISPYKKNNIIGTVLLPNKNTFKYTTLYQEGMAILDDLDNKENIIKEYNLLLDKFRLNYYLTMDIDELNIDVIIKFLIVTKLCFKPKVLVLDNIFDLMSKKESEDLIEKLLSYKDLTIIMSSNDLELSKYANYLCILDKGEVYLEGERDKVLKEDGKLNKIGLDLPFMVDLSVKLNYYDLLDGIELNMDRMVDQIWK